MSELEGQDPARCELLDTNPIIRYLMGDSVHHSPKSKALIESGRSLRITPHILAEVAFVLERFYRVARPDIVDALVELLERENISMHTLNSERVIEALRHCRPSKRVSFADALLWATAREFPPARVWTF